MLSDTITRRDGDRPKRPKRGDGSRDKANFPSVGGKSATSRGPCFVGAVDHQEHLAALRRDDNVKENAKRGGSDL
jgi:hypothetical protein